MNLINEQVKLNIESTNWGDFTWINIEKPTEKEKSYLSLNYAFHPLDLDDCLSRIQRPKLDEYKDYLFLVFHFPAYNKQAEVTESSQVSIFIGEKYLVTVHEGRLKPLIEYFNECKLSEDRRKEVFSRGSAYLLYSIVDKLVDYCFPILNKIADNINSVEENIFSRIRYGTVRKISVLRRDIISFRRIMWPMKNLVANLEPKIRRFNHADLTVYFGDTVDHLDKIWDTLEEYKEVVEILNSTYDSMTSDRMNEILRILTILTTIGTVLTVIVGYFGMNIPLPGGANPGGHVFSWLLLLSLMLTIIAGMLFYFKRKGWL